MLELLAPGGSLEGLRTAVNAGADAVYMGGTRFGARAYAQNPQERELLEAMDYCHLRGKKLYLTVNTLLKENELERELYDYLLPLYEHGLDAVLVQDFGVFRFIQRNLPGLPLHASTQMTITGVDGAKLLKRMGAERIVPARELSLAELERIHREVEIEIECFVHGALCFCYSGQCLMSSLVGGRSGNRGRCAQPCRLPYDAYRGEQRLNGSDDRYLLSLKDICTLELLPELIRAGVCSFKIEGRMKRAEYAAGVTEIYRKYLDLSIGNGTYRVEKEDERRLMDLYNRGGFSRGYYHVGNGPRMMSMQRPNHQGTLAAEVLGKNERGLRLRALEPLWAQDVLELGNSRSASVESHKESEPERRKETASGRSGEETARNGRKTTGKNLHAQDPDGQEWILRENVPAGTAFTLPARMAGKNRQAGASAVGLVYSRDNADLLTERRGDRQQGKNRQAGASAVGLVYGRDNANPLTVRPGQVLARVRCEKLLEELQENYIKKEAQVPIEGWFWLSSGQRARLTVRRDGCEVSVTGETPGMAQTRPLEEETVRRQLLKTGGTPFEFANLEIRVEDGLFYPLQGLNELRRDALEALRRQLLAGCRRAVPPIPRVSQAADIRRKFAGGEENESDARREVAPIPAISQAANIECERADGEGSESDARREVAPTTAVTQAMDTGRERAGREGSKKKRRPGLRASVETFGQLRALLDVPEIEAVYLDCYMFLEAAGKELSLPEAAGTLRARGKRCVLMLPVIWRENSIRAFRNTFPDEVLESADGLLLRSGEQLEAMRRFAGKKEMIADSGIYTYNKEARSFLTDCGIDRDTLPLECSRRDLEKRGCAGSECIVYGSLPLMVTAQCLRKNTLGCQKKPDVLRLQDRKNAAFPVRVHCSCCTNIIYNSVPLDLMPCAEEVLDLGVASCRLAFTFETGEEARRIVRIAASCLLEGGPSRKAAENGTRGHFKRGVE